MGISRRVLRTRPRGRTSLFLRLGVIFAISSTIEATLMRLVRFFLVPLRTARDIARVSDDGVQEASVTDEDREEENVVNDEYDSGYTGSTGDIIGRPDQIIDYDKSVS